MPANDPANNPVSSPADTPELYNQAEQAISAGDFTRAEQLLQQVIQQNPQWAGA
jgi:TolA-binding protein